MSDGYAMGVTALMALTGLPVRDIKNKCRKLLRFPDQPAQWEAPGTPDTAAGAWPEPVAVALARAISGLVRGEYADERVPLQTSLPLLQQQVQPRMRRRQPRS